MKKIDTPKLVCEYIWELEERLGLVEWGVNSANPWQIIRLKVYYQITQKLGIFNDPHPNSNLSILNKINFLFYSILAFVTQNPFLKSLSNKKKRSLIVPHSRKVSGVDIYTKRLEDSLTDSIVIEEKVINTNFTLSLYFIFSKIFSAIFPYSKLSTYDTNLIKEMENDILKQLDIKIDISKLIKSELRNFFILEKIYYKLLKKLGIKKIFTVVAYLKPYIVSSAKKLNIPIYEMQHGTITKYHLGYSYPNNNFVTHSPDYLLTFGKYWSETTPLAQNIEPVLYGAPMNHFKEEANCESSLLKDTILVCSQGVIGYKLFLFSLEVANLTNEQVIFNIHPSESKEAYNKIINDLEIKVPKNFLINDSTKEFFNYLKTTEYQAGVFSTSLFEGLSYNKKTVLIDLPGVEYMEGLINKFNIPIVRTPKEFVLALKTAQVFDSKKSDYFYSKNINNQFLK